MTTKNYSLLAAVIFTIIAVLQLTRAVMGWEVMVGSTLMPVWPSWVAFLVAGALAWLGYSAARG